MLAAQIPVSLVLCAIYTYLVDTVLPVYGPEQEEFIVVLIHIAAVKQPRVYVCLSCCIRLAAVVHSSRLIPIEGARQALVKVRDGWTGMLPHHAHVRFCLHRLSKAAGTRIQSTFQYLSRRACSSCRVE
ncbi:hypothetical protein C8R45DRAFT_435746 [Mycena sanguinolenta]|nr:hypothetical protein C8R45DRAFT_435746 [Mycena sanguinolenta]